MTNAVAKTIEDLRERGALSGVDVANVADVSKTTVSRWVTGKAAPQPKTQLVLSDLRYVVDRFSLLVKLPTVVAWLACQSFWACRAQFRSASASN